MSMPVLKLRQVVGFPGNIVGGTGIDATKANGTVTIDMAWNEFGLQSAIPTSPTNNILTFDTATNQYVMIPSHLLGGATAGIAEAPVNGTTYGRNSSNWVRAVAVAGDTMTGTLTVNSAVNANTAFFKNGSPWADVRAWGALANGSNDQPAIQNAINYVHANGDGVVFFPPGTYTVNSTVTNKGGVRLVGSGRGNTVIQLVAGTDTTVVAFDPECVYASLEHIAVHGYNNSGATQPCVYIPGSGTNGAPTLLQHCTIHHGKAGLKVEGADGFFENCYIWGHTYCVESYGANTYNRCKLDTVGGNSGPHSTAAFFQGAGAGTPGEVKESNFFGGDFSGNFDWSVFVDDASNGKVMLTFYGCVFGPPLALNKIRWFSALGCEFGSTDLYAGSVTGSADGVTGIVSITGSRSLSGAMTLHDNGGIVIVTAGNYNI